MKTKGFYTIQSKSMADYGVTTQKDLWDKVKADGYRGLSVTAKTVFTKNSVDGVESPYFHATFSSANMDRHGEIVMQVFDLKGFINNPVYLDSHNYDSIEHIIGKIHDINTNGGSLNGDIEFCLDNPKGVMADKMVKGGFLNTSSIGFIPTNFDNDGNILASELLEISAVAVPANADALMDKKEAEVKAEGDECDMGDGTMGVMTPDKDGKLVCMMKEEKKIEVVSETLETEKIEIKKMTPENKYKTVAKVIGRMVEEKEKNYELVMKLVKELVIDEKKERARKIYQVIRELSK